MGKQMSFSTDSINRNKFKERIFLVSVEKESFYNLTDLVPEVMEEENCNEAEVMERFMNLLNGTAWRMFEKGTDIMEITEWILSFK